MSKNTNPLKKQNNNPLNETIFCLTFIYAITVKPCKNLIFSFHTFKKSNFDQVKEVNSSFKTKYDCFWVLHQKQVKKKTFSILNLIVILVNIGNYGKRQVSSVAVLPIENIDCTWEKIDIRPIIKLILWSCNITFQCSALLHRQNENWQSFKNFLFSSFQGNRLSSFTANCTWISKISLLPRGMVTKQLCGDNRIENC